MSSIKPTEIKMQKKKMDLKNSITDLGKEKLTLEHLAQGLLHNTCHR